MAQIDATSAVAALRGEGDATRVRGVDRVAAIWSVGVHLLALLVFVPWFFSWTGVVLLAAGISLFGMIGINLAYHRLLAHRSFSCPRWLEHVLAMLGVCSAQGAPAWWVAIHRMHHHFADKEEDPHAPGRNFLWGHIAWITFQTEDMLAGHVTKRYAGDLLRDPLYVWLDKYWQGVALASWLLLPAAALTGGLLAGMSAQAALPLAASVIILGAAARDRRASRWRRDAPEAFEIAPLLPRLALTRRAGRNHVLWTRSWPACVPATSSWSIRASSRIHSSISALLARRSAGGPPLRLSA